MDLRFSNEKCFTQSDVEALFLSVNWLSGRYPERLIKALNGSSCVITAWDGDKLVALVRILDDGEMLAYLHYLLVNPTYQGRGIASKLIEMVKERYKDYLYLNLTPNEDNNIPFYIKHGFEVFEEGAAMQIMKM